MKKQLLIFGILAFYCCGNLVYAQNYGIYTETTNVNDEFAIDDVTGHLFIWSNLTAVDEPATYEGQEAWGFSVNAADWFGFGIASEQNGTKIPVDLSAYSTGYLNFAFKVPTTNTTNFKIMITDTNGGEGVVWLNNGTDGFGLVRDGDWHFLSMPLADFGTNVDFSSLHNIFAIAADFGAGGSSFSVDNVFYSASLPTSVTDVEDKPELIVSPNPADDFFSVEVNRDVLNVLVTELSGKVIYSSSEIAGRNKMTVDVSSWNKGVYMVFVNFQDGSGEVRKLVVY